MYSYGPTSRLHAAWLGHSTTSLKIDGFTILTDPVFSDRAGVNLGVTTLGVKRLVLPAVEISGLPKVDLILLSHAHMDHLRSAIAAETNRRRSMYYSFTDEPTKSPEVSVGI